MQDGSFRMVTEYCHALGVWISEECEAFVCCFLKIAEANNVAKGLYGVQYAVSATVCLQQSVIAQVLVYPESVERRCVKTGKEHVDHNKYI